jgi:hypothetical protein
MTTTITDTQITTPALVLTGSQSAAQVLASPPSAAGAPTFLTLSYQHISNAAGVQYGYPALDANAFVQVANLPVVPISKGGTGASTAAGALAALGLSEALVFAGTWNASTNSPMFVSGTGTAGYMYKVTTAGTTTLDGISSWNIGDIAVFSGITNTWNKIDGVSTEVISVVGQVGVVTASQILSALTAIGSAVTNAAQTFTKSQSATIQTITYSSTVTLDLTQGNDAQITLTGNVTFANPTSLTPGTTGVIDIIQDSTGGRTWTFGTSWRFGAAGTPSPSTAAGATDTLFYSVRSSSRIVCAIVNGTQ